MPFKLADDGHDEGVDTILLGLALSCLAGVRPTVALFVLSWYAMRGEDLHGLGSDSILQIGHYWFTSLMGLLVFCEIVSDLIPLLDHCLHTVLLVACPFVGAIVCQPRSAPRDQVITLYVVGAMLALVVHGSRASLRGVSSAHTGGHFNPILSLVETVFVLIAVPAVLAACFPMAAGVFAVVLICILVALYACLCCSTTRSSRYTQVVGSSQPPPAGYAPLPPPPPVAYVPSAPPPSIRCHVAPSDAQALRMPGGP